MRFEESGLVKDKLVEDAFNYAQEYNKSLAPEVLAQFKESLSAQYENQMLALGQAKDDGRLSEDNYENYKKRLDDAFEKKQLQLPALVERQLSAMFNKARLAPALELQQNSENNAPALVAASILLECVRDPVDYLNVDEKFGGAVSGLVAEIVHIDAYPGSSVESTAAASTDAKRLIMANLISSLDQIPAQVSRAPQGSQVSLPAKQEEKIVATAKLLWGNDKKQDKRLIEVFNRAFAAIGSDHQLEAGAKGLDVVVGAPKAPKPAANKGSKGPKFSGDEGF